jgi:NAD(P)-dependent dehydrogenase (short-subunit alcohol dehydrogenase family)
MDARAPQAGSRKDRTGHDRARRVAFAKKGAKVVVAGRRDEAGKALVKELRSFGSEAEFIKADVRKEDDVRALVDKTVARFGRLDVAVNNAGTEGQVGPITDQTAESYAATFDTNVLGVILSMKHEVRGAALAEYGKQLLHQEIRRADIDRKELVEIPDRRFLDGRSFRDPCIGDQNVEAISLRCHPRSSFS